MHFPGSASAAPDRAARLTSEPDTSTCPASLAMSADRVARETGPPAPRHPAHHRPKHPIASVRGSPRACCCVLQLELSDTKKACFSRCYCPLSGVCSVSFSLSGLAIWPELSGIASVGWRRRKTQRVELPHARCVDQTGCMHASCRGMNRCEDAATAFRLDLRCHRPPLSLLRPKSAVSPRKPP